MAKLGMHGGLDDLIRRRGITNHFIIAVLRNQVLFLLVILLGASAFAAETMWGVWMAAGFAVMTYILYSWARFFSRSPLQNYSTAFLRAVLFHFLLRLVVLAAALYACLVMGHADPLALLTGVATGTLPPILTWAWEKGSRN